MDRFYFFFLLFLSGVLFVPSFGAEAAPPPLRTELSLNGTWNFTPQGGAKKTIAVPEYWDAAPGFTTTQQATYERQVSVPNSWSGKRIKVEFEGVNHVADVYVNNTFVGNHIGGFVPFSVDVTNLVTPGSNFALKVVVKSRRLSPTVNADGYPQWPYGTGAGDFIYNRPLAGIVFDTWLRAYGKVHIEDAFVKTSYQNKTITVDYTVKNSDNVSHTVAVEADAVQGSVIGKSIAGSPITLAAGASQTVSVSAPWSNPALWNPETPNLYILNSRVKEGSTILDQESRRFGFREIWTQGNQFILNGARVNLYGTSVTWHSVSYAWDRYMYVTESTWPSTVNKFLANNIRIIRMHQQPAPDFVLDIADEKGLLMIDESALFGSFKFQTSTVPSSTFVANSKIWIEPWIKARRNHPSLIIWGAMNEMTTHARYLTSAQAKSIGDTIRLYDTTRPMTYDGERDLGTPVVNKHYPEGHTSQPTSKGTDLYGWAPIVPLNADRPTGIGEFITHYDSTGDNEHYRNKWWQGTWIRGMRYTGFTDVRPYRMEWILETPTDVRIPNIKNSFAPVALFDKEYDRLGIDPLFNVNFQPSLNEGATVNRTLVLYNDEFQDTSVTINVLVKSGATLYASGSKTFTLALGEHMDIPISFQVPNLGGSTIDMELITKKGGVEKFREAKRFKVTDAGFSGNSSSNVTIQGGVLGVASGLCHLLTSSNPVPEGFGATYNVLSSAKELLINALCPASGSGAVTINVGNGSNLQYIYHKGYWWTGSQWQLISYTGATTVADAWYVGNASYTTPTFASADLDKTNYVVTYICTWTGSTWKCGCRDNACTQGFWNLQAFRRK